MSRTSPSPTCDVIGLGYDLLEAEGIHRKDILPEVVQYAHDTLSIMLFKAIGVARSPYLPVRDSSIPWGRFNPFDGSLRDQASAEYQSEGVHVPVNASLHVLVNGYAPLPLLQGGIKWGDLRRCHDMKPVILL